MAKIIYYKLYEGGFTLVELIMAISIISILGLITTGILVQTLRGENKARVVGRVKQNGQVALDKLSEQIRQARSIVCVGSAGLASGEGATDSLVLQKTDNSYIRFRFYPPSLSVNGYIAFDLPPSPESDPSIGPEDRRNSRWLCQQTQPVNARRNLTDTDVNSGISLDYLSSGQDPNFTNKIFSLEQQSGSNSLIFMKFRVFTGIKSGNLFESNVGDDGIVFATSVQKRGDQPI